MTNTQQQYTRAELRVAIRGELEQLKKDVIKCENVNDAVDKIDDAIREQEVKAAWGH